MTKADLILNTLQILDFYGNILNEEFIDLNISPYILIHTLLPWQKPNYFDKFFLTKCLIFIYIFVGILRMELWHSISKLDFHDNLEFWPDLYNFILHLRMSEIFYKKNAPVNSQFLSIAPLNLMSNFWIGFTTSQQLIPALVNYTYFPPLPTKS